MGWDHYTLLHVLKSGVRPNSSEAIVKAIEKVDAALFSRSVRQAFKPFRIETCQRVLWLVQAKSLSKDSFRNLECDIYLGQESYAFLLRMACGLESELVGETDIFGQIKGAWEDYKKFYPHQSTTPLPLAHLESWMRKIFEDSKSIRTEYLQSTGAPTYGSLVRKILRKTVGRNSQKLILVGAGKLAQSVAPWLGDFELLLINRSVALAEDLKSQLIEKGIEKVTVLKSTSEQDKAWRETGLGILCIPSTFQLESKWAQSWERLIQPSKCIIHLGANNAQLNVWTNGEKTVQVRSIVYGLDDVLSFQEEQTRSRQKGIKRAIKACDEKAILRLLPGSPNGSISLPHGWEDLAAF